eukprot:scaffold8888_cov115-Isochrysis_galbana.AAC.6
MLGRVVHHAARLVVQVGVVPDQLHVCDEVLHRWVPAGSDPRSGKARGTYQHRRTCAPAGIQPCLDRAQIHRLLDDVVIVRDAQRLRVDRVQKVRGVFQFHDGLEQTRALPQRQSAVHAWLYPRPRRHPCARALPRTMASSTPVFPWRAAPRHE